MIVLDTNVVSEILRPRRDLAVIAWLDRQAVATLYIASVSMAELLAGAAYLPDGRRKAELRAAIDHVLKRLFSTRVLPFDADAAHFYANMASLARRAGVAISVPDGQIAAIAAAHGFSVATRDTAPFIAAGVPVVNPWLQGG